MTMLIGRGVSYGQRLGPDSVQLDVGAWNGLTGDGVYDRELHLARFGANSIRPSRCGIYGDLGL
jgi:hypothetical protein